MLEDRLRDEEWVHYPEMSPELIQYHRGPDDNNLISLTKDSSMMSDVWEFKNAVMRIVKMENLGGRQPQQLLVYLRTEELITSHQMLEDGLRDEGWVHYPEMPPEFIQDHGVPMTITSSPSPVTSPLLLSSSFGVMSDVWEFKNGVIRIVEMENLGGRRPQQLLVYLQTEELIISHQMLEDWLRDEGWVHYPEMSPELIHYHRGPDDNYLISLPRDFSNFSLIISI
ncbi:hypothetical protein ZIOFF_035114 [Zingiber officinale]|uniref:Uncharacterized protein n=1 Tax=Zingiber officinale TaxID=94328 RepID=A0A8J5L707_ZINOF|nr:hypothetical protein ZIOFF_035114 [Zingiber officinale]